MALVRVLFAALTVTSASETGCPDERTIADRLRASGIVLRDEDDVRVTFSMANGQRRAEIQMPGAEPRRIEHGGADCSSLTEATVALLTVLLDERASAPRPASPPPPSPAPAPRAEEPFRALRAEAGALFSTGIVADFAGGVTIGGAWWPVRWASVGLTFDIWPPRDHAVRGGTVSVGASTIALVGCIGVQKPRGSLEGCVLGHGGFYALAADGFPVVHEETRSLYGGEAAIRAAVTIAEGLGVFVRAGMWVPLTRLDVTVRGAESGFSTTSIGPKGTVGIELAL
jgi:hypothetical protein